MTCYMTRSELMTEEVDIKMWGTATVTTVILLVLGMWNSVLAQYLEGFSKPGHHSSMELLKQKMEAVQAILGAKTPDEIAEGAPLPRGL